MNGATRIRYCLYVAAVSLLVTGAIASIPAMTISGAIAVVLDDVVELWNHYRLCIKIRDLGPDRVAELLCSDGRGIHWIRSALSIVGLLAIVVLREERDETGMLVAGCLLWFSTLAAYLMSGWVARDVAKLPVYMRWGTWRLARPCRRGRK